MSIIIGLIGVLCAAMGYWGAAAIFLLFGFFLDKIVS